MPKRGRPCTMGESTAECCAFCQPLTRSEAESISQFRKRVHNHRQRCRHRVGAKVLTCLDSADVGLSHDSDHNSREERMPTTFAHIQPELPIEEQFFRRDTDLLNSYGSDFFGNNTIPTDDFIALAETLPPAALWETLRSECSAYWNNNMELLTTALHASDLLPHLYTCASLYHGGGGETPCRPVLALWRTLFSQNFLPHTAAMKLSMTITMPDDSLDPTYIINVAPESAEQTAKDDAAIAAISVVLEQKKPSAVIVEVICAASGGARYSSYFLRRLRDLCTSRSILFVADETMTAIRTGKRTLIDAEQIQADFVLLGKLWSGLAFLLIRRQVLNADSRKAMLMCFTEHGDVHSMAKAILRLRWLLSNNVTEQVTALGLRWATALHLFPLEERGASCGCNIAPI